MTSLLTPLEIEARKTKNCRSDAPLHPPVLCGQIPLSRALYLLPVTTASPDKTSIDLPNLVLPLSRDHPNSVSVFRIVTRSERPGEALVYESTE